MVDPWLLTLDASSTVVSLALPGGLWTLLFFLAWERPAFAESVGLGRRTFWLLLPGALLASFALLPIAPISDDWLAVSFAGAALPILAGAYAVRSVMPSAASGFLRLIGFAAVETGAMLWVVLPSSAGTVARLGSATGLGVAGASLALEVTIGAVACAALAAWARTSTFASAPRVALLGTVMTAVVVLTFAGSSSIPGVGIVESFPYFLLPPIAAGIATGLLAPRILAGAEGAALPIAYLATTLGVLVGADVLREPPLYGHGPAGLYAIGGAGVLDLVYLSGLLALAAAYATHVAFERSWAPLATGRRREPRAPIHHLRDAYRAGVAGDIRAALAGSLAASSAAEAQARACLGPGTPAPRRPWEGLPVPGWVVADHANLERTARSGTTDPREGFRAWLTARWLVLVGRDLALRRFASIGERITAFAIDLVVLALPAAGVFAEIARRTPGGFGSLLLNVGFNAAIVGFVAAALLYFAIAEAWVGTTIGKAAVGLAVRTRTLEIPDGESALVRNLPLAPILTLVGLGTAVTLALVVKGAFFQGGSLLGVGVPLAVFSVLGIGLLVAIGTGLLGSIGVLAMALTWERQRVGDLWAGTWVVRAPTPTPAEPPGPPSRAADRSG